MTAAPEGERSSPGEEGLQTMSALLDTGIASYPHVRRGEIMEGVVVGISRDGVLVDIGAKSEGIIPPQEMHCLSPEGPMGLKIGEKLLVFVLQSESGEGQIILSLDRARGEKGWRILQDYQEQGEAFEAHVTGYNRGGLLVNVEGVNAFIPLSQIAERAERSQGDSSERNLAEWAGKPLLVKVIELNRRRNRAILSQRAALQERKALQKDRLLQELKEGDILTGRITSIREFGIFVDIGGADGLVHLSELSWERTPKPPQDVFRLGDEIKVYVMKIDKENRKIALSLRRAQPEQWQDIVARYHEGQIVVGQVTKLTSFGAFVRLEGPLEGLIHISELADRLIQHPREVVKEEDIVPVKIVRIEYDRHRLGLSLRQARDKMEEEGWVFNDNGGVEIVPEDLQAAVLGETAALVPTADESGEPEGPGAQAEADVEAKVVAVEAQVKIEDKFVTEPPPDALNTLDESLEGAATEAIVTEADIAGVENEDDIE